MISNQLKAALVILTTTYKDLALTARGLVVDAKEVASALASATPDTAEHVALQVLHQQNPYTPQKKPMPIEE